MDDKLSKIITELETDIAFQFRDIAKNHNPEPKKVESVRLTENNPAYIVALGDAHLGHMLCNKEKLKATIDFIDRHRDVYTILLGDLAETATKSSVGTGLFSEDMHISDQLNILTELLMPLAEKDKILAMVTGNHEMRINNLIGIDPSRELARRLGIGYHGFQAYLSLDVGSQNYKIVAWHGSGGSTTKAGKIRAAEKLKNNVMADVYLCFHPDQEIVLGDGTVKKISCLEEREDLLTADHICSYVGGVYSRDHKGKMYKISVDGLPKNTLNCTHNHPILAVTKDRIKDDMTFEGKPEYIEAKDLSVGDYVATPALEDIFFIKNLDIKALLDENDPDRNDTMIDVNYGTAAIAGYALGCGSYLDALAKTNDCMFFHTKDEELTKRLSKLLSTNGVENIGMLDGRRSYIKAISKKLFVVARHLFEGIHDSQDKTLPVWIMQADPKIQSAFIEGYLNTQKKRRNNKYVLDFTNKQLAWQIRTLLFRLGLDVTIKQKRNKLRVVTSLKKHEFLQSPYVVPEYRYSKIKKIKTYNYDGPVYSLAVPNNNSYCASGVSVKNSGHTHDRSYHDDFIDIINDDGVVVRHHRHYVVCGSFLEYSGGYAEMKGLSPSGTGGVIIKLNSDEKDVLVTY